MASFSQLEVSNLALAHLPAAPISSVDENSLEARECRRFYPHVIADILTAPHEWSFANARATLAELATNDRPQEWLHAYGLPTDMSSPIRVLPDLQAAGVGLPVPLPGEPYAEAWSVSGAYYETPYIIDGSTLYSNVDAAIIEYVRNDLTGVNVSQLVVTAAALDLASRIVVPVKKDSDRESKLMAAADTAWQRAMADDQNRQPRNTGQYISEPMAARRGYLTEAP